MANTETNAFINHLAYISQFQSNFLSQNEVETISFELYKCLECLSAAYPIQAIMTMLSYSDNHDYVISNKFSIRFRDKWLLKLILLSSLKHCKELFGKSGSNSIGAKEKQEVLHQAIMTFNAAKFESIFIVRLILNIIKKDRAVLSPSLALKLVLLSQDVERSPICDIRRNGHNISSIALPALGKNNMKHLLDLDLLPIKGTETAELMGYFRKACHDKLMIYNLVGKVINMFSNNIENREGGFLYKSVLTEDFDQWKKDIWPLFLIRLQYMDCEGEFFQSLVKYWIPENVTHYKLEFYQFIYLQPVSTYLKGQILLETRRKGLIIEYDKETVQLLTALFCDSSTASLALKIVSLYFKISLYPGEAELELVLSYLYGLLDILDNEEFKYLHRFLSQIGVVGYHLLNLKDKNIVQENRLIYYKKYVSELFDFCVNLLKTNRRPIGAQILCLLWKLASDRPFCATFKLETDPMGFYGNVLPQKHVFKELVKSILEESHGSCLEVIKLAQSVILEDKLYSNEYLLQFIDDCSNQGCIRATETVKNISGFMVSQNNRTNRLALLQLLLDATNEHLYNFSPSSKSIFKGALLFEAILKIDNFENSCQFLGFEKNCLPVVERVLKRKFIDEIYQQEIRKTGSISEDFKHNIHVRIEKIVEAFLNSILQYIGQHRALWTTEVVKALIKIIETSNMKRPTTLSADILKIILKTTNKEYYKKDSTSACINKNREQQMYDNVVLLQDTIDKLFMASPRQSLTIRRNPESRLIIHTICQSDIHEQKPLLNNTISQLLKILSNNSSPDPTVSSAIHCIEILISDNTLYNHTLKYIPDVVVQCVSHFKNRNWVVRNADIQLARSLIDRFLGVLIGHNNRHRTLEDLFCLFPQLSLYFCQTLTCEPLTDSAVIVMQFFSESQIRKLPIESTFVGILREVFLRLFVAIIKRNFDYFGRFGVRAYTSLCLEEDIPIIIQDIVHYVVTNISYIKERHTMGNYILLLSELNDKYSVYAGDLTIKTHQNYLIKSNFEILSGFLEQFDNKQFDLLLLKVLTHSEALSKFKTSIFDRCEYTQRVWQHNYVPFLIINGEVDRLEEVLREVLAKDVLECMQFKILSILIDRFYKREFCDNVCAKLVDLLITKVLSIDDSRCYLLLCYFKVLLLFFECSKGFDAYIIEQIRRNYSTAINIYKTFIFVLVLSKIGDKNDCDKKFVKFAFKCCHKQNLDNFETAQIISEMLPHFYTNFSCVCDKYSIFKMCVHLIKIHGLWDFVSFITNTKISNATSAMARILNFDLLSKSFDSKELAVKFINEFYEYVCSVDGVGFECRSKTYYVEEKTVFVDRWCIDRLVLKFLHDFGENEKKIEWVSVYEKIKEGNKR